MKKFSFDYVITMGCGDECAAVPSRRREDWNIPDPKQLERDAFHTIRDLIASRVKELVSEI